MICDRRVRVAQETSNLELELKQYEQQLEDAITVINAHRPDSKENATLEAMRAAQPLKREAEKMISRITERLGLLSSPPVKLGQREL